MKKTIVKIGIFSCTLALVFADQIEKNKKRIQQIDSQVNKNNQQINKNKSEITKAKKTENTILVQIKELDKNITRLQKEYNDAEKKYREILSKIGVNNVNINAKIVEINKNSEIINVNKEDLQNKIKMWDKIRRNKEMSILIKNNGIVKNDKLNHDLKILFNKQKDYIQTVENLKKGAEGEKAKEEMIKAKNEDEAKIVQKAKNELEKKNKELNAAKKEKNKLVTQLRGKQATLNTENKKIEKSNSQLAAEKKKLNAQIQAIIQKAIKEKELAAKKAEEAKKKQLEAEKQKKATETQKKVETSTKKETEKTTTKTKEQVAKGTGNLIMPMNGSIVVNYGQEKVAGLKSNGIEIRGSLGQTVKAADSGVVIYAGSLNNLGGVVIIDHGSLVTVYGNLSGVSVSKGTKITKGQSIGTLGLEKTSKQPNLYFETRRGLNVVNPMSYL